MISQCVKPLPEPAVFLGGLDSIIILHHLRENSKEKICTYSYAFEADKRALTFAMKVSKHYATQHKTIIISMMEIMREYPKILKHLEIPRFSNWIFWCIRAAFKNGVKNCYIGEGADEHFGGYWYKPKMSYVEQWSGLYVWGLPNYKQLFDIFNLHFEAPFTYLDWRETLPYFDYEQHKKYLREAYQGILPDFVVAKKKDPANIDYFLLWKEGLNKHFPEVDPENTEEIKQLFNVWVTKTWFQERYGEIGE